MVHGLNVSIRELTNKCQPTTGDLACIQFFDKRNIIQRLKPQTLNFKPQTFNTIVARHVYLHGNN